MKIYQSLEYSTFMQKKGWEIKEIEEQRVFIKDYIDIGRMVMMQGIKKLPKVITLQTFIKKYYINRLVIETDNSITQEEFNKWYTEVSKIVQIVPYRYSPSKTNVIDLNKPKNQIFLSFHSTKRRAIRKAEKYSLHTHESEDIDLYIKYKKKSRGILGFITDDESKKLWESVPSGNKKIIFATVEKNTVLKHTEEKIVAGVLIIFIGRKAYYWSAFTLTEGKQKYAPSLLVWHAIQYAKNKKMESFDFFRLWDERLPNLRKDWKGFTNFKEEFGGKSVYFPIQEKRSL